MTRTCEREECLDKIQMEHFAQIGRENIRTLIFCLADLCDDSHDNDTLRGLVKKMQECGLDKLVLRLYTLESKLIREDFFKE